MISLPGDKIPSPYHLYNPLNSLKSRLVNCDLWTAPATLFNWLPPSSICDGDRCRYRALLCKPLASLIKPVSASAMVASWKCKSYSSSAIARISSSALPNELRTFVRLCVWIGCINWGFMIWLSWIDFVNRFSGFCQSAFNRIFPFSFPFFVSFHVHFSKFLLCQPKSRWLVEAPLLEVPSKFVVAGSCS